MQMEHQKVPAKDRIFALNLRLEPLHKDLSTLWYDAVANAFFNFAFYVLCVNLVDECVPKVVLLIYITILTSSVRFDAIIMKLHSEYRNPFSKLMIIFLVLVQVVLFFLKNLVGASKIFLWRIFYSTILNLDDYNLRLMCQ